MNRGSGKKPKGKLLAVWVPGELLPSLDRAVRKEGSNRSQFIRDAIHRKLARHQAAKS